MESLDANHGHLRTITQVVLDPATVEHEVSIPIKLEPHTYTRPYAPPPTFSISRIINFHIFSLACAMMGVSISHFHAHHALVTMATGPRRHSRSAPFIELRAIAAARDHHLAAMDIAKVHVRAPRFGLAVKDGHEVTAAR